MGDAQPGRGVHPGAQEQDVHVHGSGTVVGSAGPAAQPALDLLAGVEQALGLEVGLDPQAGVEEPGLVQDLSHRSRLVHRRAGQHAHPKPLQLGRRGLQLPASIAEVGPEPEVAGLGSSLGALGHPAGPVTRRARARPRP